MKMIVQAATVAAFLAVPFLVQSTPAAANDVRAGVLTCRVSGGTGFIIGSNKAVSCVFEGQGRREHYSGSFRKFGIDIGSTDQARIKWVVFAPTDSPAPGALAGEYGGITGEATVGGGVGAHALVGGSNRSITLQPFSAQVQTGGANLALGVGRLSLRHVR